MSEITPAVLLEELLRFREVSTPATADFVWSHEKLCEKCKQQIETLGESFLKYRHIAYVVQGPRDQGVDVVLKSSSDEGVDSFVGIQIKSYAELDDKSNDLSKNLKAGFHDTRGHYGTELDRYYIALCGDAKKHAKRISAITNEFVKEPKVRVIAPRHLHTFMNMPESTILAIVDSMLRKDDFVKAEAKREVREYSDSELFFLLTCLAQAFESGSDVLPYNFFERSFDRQDMESRFGDDSFDRALMRFHDAALESFAVEGSTRVRAEAFSAVRALYFDFEVRYGESPEERLNHMFELLRI
jgi:hypothetical protein